MLIRFVVVLGLMLCASFSVIPKPAFAMCPGGYYDFTTGEIVCPDSSSGTAGSVAGGGGGADSGATSGSYVPPPPKCGKDLKGIGCVFTDPDGELWTFVGGDIDWEQYDGDPPPAKAKVPSISPGMAGRMAAARLVMHPASVGLGPDPQDNEYKMIPVGFPIWLWADGGDTGTSSSSESVAGLNVSLTARMTKINWSMGDGTSFTCEKGTAYKKGAVVPATPSPDCGHRYEQVGDYTITATTHWSIDWSAGGQSGSIPFSMSRSRDITIGELQVVVR